MCQEPGGPVYIDAYVWDMLYPGVRASAPQEVGTVIITQWNRTLAGNYFGVSGNAYNWDCDIIVADWKDRVITHRAKVRGPRAPAEIYVSNAATHAPTEHLGNDGKMAVVGWVNSLHEAP
ncbi:MAG: hypothetical protein NTW87_06870 [Planctomycetota bacterium]|nr:hypothetical protein [Planctomycetota bacterium]